VPEIRSNVCLRLSSQTAPEYHRKGHVMHLFLVFLLGCAAGVVFSVQYKVAGLVGSILCAWTFIAFSSAFNQSERGFLDTALSAVVVAAALQFGYVAGLIFQTVWASRATKSDTDPAMTRR
jgi:hypothetical protein